MLYQKKNGIKDEKNVYDYSYITYIRKQKNFSKNY